MRADGQGGGGNGAAGGTLNPAAGRYQQVKALVFTLLGHPREQRSSELRKRCGGDTALRAEVESLLDFDDRPRVLARDPDRLVHAAVELIDAEADRLATTLPGRIDGYRIIRRMAVGGMSTVFEAEEEDPPRRVALKLLRLGFGGMRLLRRFHTEARILARLAHPSIARLLATGTACLDGTETPYLVIELIHGRPLTEHADAHRLTIPQRLEMLLELAEGVSFAHAHGIVHRDLKPDNLLVDEFGNLKILDFGIARLTDVAVGYPSPIGTHTGELLGTLSYMSPEQAAGDPTGVDHRSDIYSMGVIAYELLCGRLPYDVSEMPIPQATRVIQEREPPAPRRCRPSLNGDLEAILLTALQKDRTRRYASAERFGQDIRRHLDGLPVTARKDTFRYRTAKFVRRHSVGTAAALTIGLLLVGGIATTLSMARAAVAERNEATRQAKIAARTADYLERLLVSIDPNETGAEVPVRQILDRAVAGLDAELGDQPKVAGRIHRILGTAYRKLGVYPVAEQQLRRALAISKSTYGPVDRTVADCLLPLGRLLSLQGNYVEAEALLGDALEIRRRFAGDDDPAAVKVKEVLAAVLAQRGDYDAAERLLREAVRSARKCDPPEPRLLARSLISLSVFLDVRGEHAEAEPLCREALDLFRELLGDEHKAVKDASYVLARLLAAKGDYDDAERLLREVLAFYRREFGEDHPAVVGVLGYLARVLSDKGEYDAAEGLCEEMLVKARQAFGGEHMAVVEALYDLGIVLHTRGDNARAEPLFRQALAIAQKLLGDEHPSVVAIRDKLAEVLDAQADGAQADSQAKLEAGLKTR